VDRNSFISNFKKNIINRVPKAFIENLCRSHDNVVLLTHDFHFVTADQIRDNGNHLSAEESIIFTDMLAQRLLEFQDNHEK